MSPFDALAFARANLVKKTPTLQKKMLAELTTRGLGSTLRFEELGELEITNTNCYVRMASTDF
jgi:hypothetical protein